MTKTLDQWNLRPPEEAFLFNPAFIASLLFEFSREYARSKVQGAPLPLLPVALAVVLHHDTRERLPLSTVSSLYDWMQKNEDLLVGFGSRTRGLMPYFKEALVFALSHKSMEFSEGHHLVCGPTRAHFSAPFQREATVDLKNIIDRVKFVARWFAKSGSEASIMACWGVKP